MRLVEPSKEMEKHFIDMANDNMQANELRYQFAFEENFDFGVYIEKLRDNSKAEKIKPGYVPTTTFWLIDDHGKILGVSRLRHYLMPHLEIEGGNIGYDVPPSERMKGYGTILLEHTLLKAKEMGIKRVLITCDSDNIGSAKIIQNNGGIYENESISTESGKSVSRYWISSQMDKDAIKHWVVVNGSPRIGMNSDKLIETLERTSYFKDAEFTKFKLDSMNISPCTGCNQCRESNRCTIEDDFHALIETIIRHKKLILISPSFNYNVTAQMKCFIDRLFSQYAFSADGCTSQLGEGIEAIIIGICAGDDDGMGYTMEAMKRPLQDHGIQIIYEYKYLHTKHMPVWKNENLCGELETFFSI